MRQLRKFARLSWADQRLIVKSVVLMWAFRLALWFLPFRRISSLRRHKTSRLSRPSTSPARVSWAVRLAARYVPQSTCLVQALTARKLLETAGIAAQMQIGVTKKQERFEAHAWVEAHGEVVSGGIDLEQYTRLPSFDLETKCIG